MVTVDIFEVPISCNNNHYLLVIQGFFTTWPDVAPLPDLTAAQISRELVKLFPTYCWPDVQQSDQGRNFESTILSQVLQAFDIAKTHTTTYNPHRDGMVERFN